MARHSVRAPGHLQTVLVQEVSLSGEGRPWQDGTLAPLPGKDATLRGGGGERGAGGFPTEAIRRHPSETKHLSFWAGLGCGHGAQTSRNFLPAVT